MYETLGARLGYLISELHITKTAFAGKLKVSQPYITKLVSNNGTPSERLIDDICEKWGVNKNWLVNGGNTDEMFKKDFEIDELSDFCAEITEGKDPFITEMLLKYRRLSPQHKQAIWEIYKEWTNKKED